MKITDFTAADFQRATADSKDPESVFIRQALKEQLELEDYASSKGAERIRTNIQKGALSQQSKTVQRELVELTNTLSEGVDKFLRAEMLKTKRNVAYPNILLMCPDKLAFLALRVYLDRVTKNKISRTALANAMARAYRDNYDYGVFKREDCRAHRELEKKLKFKSGYARQKQFANTIKKHELGIFAEQDSLGFKALQESIANLSAKEIAEKEDAALLAFKSSDKFQRPKGILRVKDQEFGLAMDTLKKGPQWDAKAMTAMGETMINLIIDYTGLCEKRNERSRYDKQETYVYPTEKLIRVLDDADLKDRILQPYQMPMVIPPKDWTKMTDTPFYNEELNPMKFIKSSAQAKLLESAPLESFDATMAAVNVIQGTAWQLNPDIVPVFLEMNTADCTIKKFAGAVCPEQLEKPWSEDWPQIEITKWIKDNPEAHADYKAKAHLRYAAIEKHKSHRIVQAQQESILQEFSSRNKDVIYFPHNVDFRGRCYPIAGVGAISPQGSDSAKGLLRFAKGKPLGEDGIRWLAIHLSNCYGNDKCSLDDRVLWTYLNTDKILAASSNPSTDEYWRSASKPFQFLAAAYEWSRMTAMGDAGAEMVSHIPIAQDGSCNALQHHAAMAGCKTSAKNVNIVPSDLPVDLYSLVLRSLEKKLAASTDPVDQQWLSRINRDIVKRPCMTTGYGVTPSGVRKQLEQEFKKQQAAGDVEPFTGTVADKNGREVPLTPARAAYKMASLLCSAIGESVEASVSIMEWLKGFAKEISKSGRQFEWETPTGFPAVHSYYKQEKGMVYVSYGGQTSQISLKIPTKEIDPSKNANSAAANFTHSYDQSHMVMVINNLADLYGIDSFASVHDSFAVHAADTWKLFDVTRACFVAMYEDEPLKALYEYWEKKLTGEKATVESLETFNRLKPPPPRQAMDLGVCKDSEYFFA